MSTTLFWLVLLALNSHDVASGQQSSQWSEDHLLPAHYDRQVVPTSDVPVVVLIKLEINSVVEVSEPDQAITFDFFYYQTWNDPRLDVPANFDLNEPLILDKDWGNKLWTPDDYFVNAQEVKTMNQLNPVQHFIITGDRNVTEVLRVTAKFTCKMDLGTYPQDVQECSMDIASLTKPNAELVLKWQSFNFPPTVQTSKFKITNAWTGNCIKENLLGEFSCLQATIKLVRRFSYYLIRYYATTFLATISCFVGFWIPVLGYPARVALIITPMINFLLSQNIGTINDVGVAYVTALHWWIMWCNAFVFASLIEYAMALSWAHFINEKKDAKVKFSQMNRSISDPSKWSYGPKGYYFGNNGWFAKIGEVIDKVLDFFFGQVDYHKDPLMRNKVDYCARIVFPILYILFVLIFIFCTVCPWAVQYNNSYL